jgi:hypothetical protein
MGTQVVELSPAQLRRLEQLLSASPYLDEDGPLDRGAFWSRIACHQSLTARERELLRRPYLSLGQRTRLAGIRLERWSLEKPGRTVDLVKRGLGLGAIAAAVVLTGLAAGQAAYSIEAVPRFLTAAGAEASTYHLDLIQPAAMVPSFDFSGFQVRITPPDPKAAFDPMFVDHRTRVDAAVEALKSQIATALTWGALTGLAAAGTIVAAIRLHPFRHIEANSVVFSQQSGWLIEKLGRLL